jgi:hypothetical protein
MVNMSRYQPPEYLARDVLERQDFAAACAGRDLGAILRIAVQWGGPGFSISHVSRRCEMSLSQAADYTKRGRQATKLEIIERVADGLHVPGYMLGITERPWESGSSESSHPARTFPDIAAETATAAYAGRGLVTRGQWNEIIDSASEIIFLYGMTEFGYASDDDVPGILAGAISRGCQVRILLLDPEYDGAGSIDADEGSPPGTLSARIRASLARFGKMREECGENFDIRTYGTHPSISVVRADERMIVTPYLGSSTGSNSPTFEFRADSAPKIFERYERHLDNSWKLAGEWA